MLDHAFRVSLDAGEQRRRQAIEEEQADEVQPWLVEHDRRLYSVLS